MYVYAFYHGGNPETRRGVVAAARGRNDMLDLEDEIE
jgi:hypothetical protein